MLRFVIVASLLAAPAAAQQVAPATQAPAPAPSTGPASEIVVLEQPQPTYPDPTSYAAAISGAVESWVAAQKQVLDEQRAELEQRRALLDREAALLDQQRALADRQAELTPPDEVSIPEKFMDDAQYAEQSAGNAPDTFKPGTDGEGFRPGPNLDTFSAGPSDTHSEFFTTEDPPESP